MNQTARDADSPSSVSADKPPADQSHTKRSANPVKRFLSILGPGLITGASDDDPSGIGTYAMAGALLGYATLWTALITFPLMAGVQFICAKIGLVTGSGIGRIMRQHYSKSIAYPAVIALIIANTINAAADIMAIAAGINLLIPIPIVALVLPISLLILVVQVWGSYNLIQKIFKWLTLALFAYIGSAFLARPDWHEVLKGTLIPTVHLDSNFLSMLVAILGTTISPYLFFWQANQEVEDLEAKNHSSHHHAQNHQDDRDQNHDDRPVTATKSQLKIAAWDVNVGMLLSNVVMFFIILATAATLHRTGHTHIDTATDAAEALRPIAGNAAFVLMALGLIGSGILAVPILTGSGAYALAETLGWNYGLDCKPGEAKQFYWIIAASTLAALAIDYSGINAMNALFWTAVINGFLSPPLLVLVMFISNNKKVMGHRTNGKLLNLLGWTTTVLMTLAAAILVYTWIHA